MRPAAGTDPGARRAGLVLVLMLAALVGVYGRVLGYEFVAFDDLLYVGKDAPTTRGLGLEGVREAFVSLYLSNWHPLTWLSLMLDFELWGSAAGGFHATNLLLHLANALLLYLALARLTGSRWRSLLAVALWALHPLRVESVAWVSERKDVLSGLFFVGVLHAYARYAEAPRARGRYGWVVLLLALGLMAKPMLVTLPCVLLLLDFWPLGRLTGRTSALALLREKGWLFALVAASCVITLVAQRGVTIPLERIPFGLRLANALIAWAGYLGDTFWPVRLAAFYPHPRAEVALPLALGSSVLLLAVSGAAFAWARRLPWLAVGWFWYLGTLLPVIGLVQVGLQARADRYTYLPGIGIALLLAWGFEALSRRLRLSVRVAVALALVAVSALAAATYQQAGYWENTERLFRHALAVTSRNPLIHFYLGRFYWDEERNDEAVAEFEQALREEPEYLLVHVDLAKLLSELGDHEGALQHYRTAVRIRPQLAAPHFHLGTYLYETGDIDGAIESLSEAVRLDPNDGSAHTNLGNALRTADRPEEALLHYREAVRLDPRAPVSHYNLGNALAFGGNLAEARVEFETALDLSPDLREARRSLALTLALQGESAAALRELARVLAEDPNDREARALHDRLQAGPRGP